MRAILINPEDKTIEEIDTDARLQSLYAALKVDCITSLRVSQHDVMFLDDEGLMREGQSFFTFGEYPQPLAGRAIILGTDDEGNEVAARIDIATIRGAVQWARPDLRWNRNEIHVEDGPGFSITRIVPHFTTGGGRR